MKINIKITAYGVSRLNEKYSTPVGSLIVYRVLGGESYRKVGEKYNLSAERVRQIVKKYYRKSMPIILQDKICDELNWTRGPLVYRSFGISTMRKYKNLLMKGGD